MALFHIMLSANQSLDQICVRLCIVHFYYVFMNQTIPTVLYNQAQPCVTKSLILVIDECQIINNIFHLEEKLFALRAHSSVYFL